MNQIPSAATDPAIGHSSLNIGHFGPQGPALLTGATGFLGARIRERLISAGRSLTIVSRTPQPALAARGIRVVTGSLADPAICAEAVRGVETVFHVAARVGVWGRYADFHQDNVVATRTLLAAARAAGVRRFVHTSTPSVVYNGLALADADESLPLTAFCPSPYPLSKALAEREVLAANTPGFATCALRPHLIWGVGDPHLVPRILARAAAGRLRIVGRGRNRVDMVHVENAADAHLLAELALAGPAAGRAYFITNGEPINLWKWIDELLRALGRPPLPTGRLPLGVAYALGAACEAAWTLLRRADEPPMTRFIAAELAKDHWFNLAAARRDLGYAPRISMAAGTAELIASLRAQPNATQRS